MVVDRLGVKILKKEKKLNLKINDFLLSVEMYRCIDNKKLSFFVFVKKKKSDFC